MFARESAVYVNDTRIVSGGFMFYSSANLVSIGDREFGKLLAKQGFVNDAIYGCWVCGKNLQNSV